MHPSQDRTLLPLIDQALAEPGWLPAIPGPLQEGFAAERLEQCRLFNRRMLITLTLIFDAYWLNELSTAQEIVALSGMLRFGLMTPAVLLFTWVDRNGGLGRHYARWLLLLTFAPAVITAALCVRASATGAMLDIRAAPLILLGTSMAVRLPPTESLVNSAVAPFAFIASLVFCRAVPGNELGSLALIEVSIAAAAIGFNLQLEWRDRRMFLLNTADQIMRELLGAANQGLVRETLTDALTGIANRRCFEDTLAQFWQHSAMRPGAVGLIMADIDHFKQYNDHYGHQAGDDCLRLIAARISGLIREQDVLARYGGEEFAILLPEATPEIVRGVAERVREGVERLGLAHEGLTPPGIVTLSLGYGCVLPQGGAIMRDLVALADGELYAAKRAGRNLAFSAQGSSGF